MLVDERHIIFLRHAQSAEKQIRQTDHERVLSEDGRTQATEVGLLLKKEKYNIDLIVASSAIRTKTTAELIAEKLDYTGRIRLIDALYQASVIQLLEHLIDISERSVLVVGHNPTISHTVTYLTGHDVYFSPAQGASVYLPRQASWWEASDARIHHWLR
ncbi:MAG: histidine phosphatase family protein [Cyclobacteriaceae bacterium]|jgi:phosphohistidine phosphatase|nr:histidine phosphatase family protein [Cyclobacteriaceae bacterium]